MNVLEELNGHPTAQLTDQQLRDFLRPHFHLFSHFKEMSWSMRQTFLDERDRGALDAVWLDIEDQINRWVAANAELTIASKSAEPPT